MKKGRILFFLLPFVLILFSIYYLNQFNLQQMRGKFLEITVAEGLTIGNLMELSGSYLLAEGQHELTSFLDHLYQNESILYIGVFNGPQLVHLLTRYEGFFPVVPGPGQYRILDTAMGKIFETNARFNGPTGETYHLYIGFDYEFLTTFERAAQRNFLIIAALFFLVMIAVLALVVYFDKRFYLKTLEWQQEKQEKERFKELSLLTSEIAHEIKNPLNGLYLSFCTLEKYCADSQDALFYRQAIKDEVRRLNGILESYTGLAKEITPRYTRIDLAALAETYQFLLTQEWQSAGLPEGKTHITFQGSATVLTDPDLLKQILLNLTKNSIEGGADQINILFNGFPDRLSIEFQDNGRGIDAVVADSVFKPYFSTKTKGLGLGLPIVSRLVMVLSGDIRLESHKPGLTRFVMQFIFPKFPPQGSGINSGE